MGNTYQQRKYNIDFSYTLPTRPGKSGNRVLHPDSGFLEMGIALRILRDDILKNFEGRNISLDFCLDKFDFSEEEFRTIFFYYVRLSSDTLATTKEVLDIFLRKIPLKPEFREGVSSLVAKIQKHSVEAVTP